MFTEILDADTKMLLMNAAYFEGEFEKPFDSKMTGYRDFHLNERTTRVPTMFITEYFKFGGLPKLDARFIEIPFKVFTIMIYVGEF